MSGSLDGNTTRDGSDLPDVPAADGRGWLGSQLTAPQCAPVAVPAAVRAELLTRARQLSAGAVPPEDPALPATAGFARLLRERLAGRLGFVRLSGFPRDAADERLTRTAFTLFAAQLGYPVSQTLAGDRLARVEDVGARTANPTHRGHQSSDALAFHADRTDLIGLLCLRQAQEGGLSRLVSVPAVHDIIRAEHPQLLGELYRPLPQDRRGEQAPGEPPWCTMPVFHRDGDRVVARYLRRFVNDSQRHPGAPRLTDRQVRALDLFDDVLQRPGVSHEMELRVGDVQLIDNFRILHARTAFVDPPHAPGRLLLRVWLSWSDSPALPADFAPLYGCCAAGTVRGGVWPPGLTGEIGTPVDQAGGIAGAFHHMGG